MEQSEIVNQKDKLSQQSLVNAAVPDFLIKTYQMLEVWDFSRDFSVMIS